MSIISDLANENTNWKDILVFYENDTFEFDTGDIYNGDFEIRRKEHTCKMHGTGEYTTIEGDIYEGIWIQDLLCDNVTIKYADGSHFEGVLKNGAYNATGKYTYPDGTELQSSFSENCPVGDLDFIDPSKHVWSGKAELGGVYVLPVNHFYDGLEEPKRINKNADTYMVKKKKGEKTSKSKK